MKRPILVDTMGLVMAVLPTPADDQDRDATMLLLAGECNRWTRMKKVNADGGYAGVLEIPVQTLCKWELEIVPRRPDQKGLAVLPKRWIVERTFAWLDKYRRLSKDDERLVESSLAFIYRAIIHLMLRRLARG